MTDPEAAADREIDFHPAFGERWEITRSTADTAGESFEATIHFDPRTQGPPPHRHPNSEESMEVVEGTIDIQKAGKWTTLGPGDTITIPAGTPHTFRLHDQPTTIAGTIRPAGRSEAFFRHLRRLIDEGKIKQLPPKDPRSVIYSVMLFDEYPDWSRPTGPAAGFFKAFALVGKALRIKL